jgi:hypothetical protein
LNHHPLKQDLKASLEHQRYVAQYSPIDATMTESKTKRALEQTELTNLSPILIRDNFDESQSLIMAANLNQQPSQRVEGT